MYRTLESISYLLSSNAVELIEEIREWLVIRNKYALENIRIVNEIIQFLLQIERKFWGSLVKPKQ